MRFRCVIEMDNAAFDDDPEGELARCLTRLASREGLGWGEGWVIDTNGNTVGRWSIEGEIPTAFDPTQGAEGETADWNRPMAGGDRPDDDPYVDDALDLDADR